MGRGKRSGHVGLFRISIHIGLGFDHYTLPSYLFYGNALFKAKSGIADRRGNTVPFGFQMDFLLVYSYFLLTNYAFYYYYYIII